MTYEMLLKALLTLNSEVLPKEKVVVPDRHIGVLDFSNPYTSEDD